ncbi:hypothetical protein AA101099_2929 [Neoasaia chiangmaiensis NBRC 101099]|uniref:hypothetical protein n=1 Tax=Neoasaia chiangmaiensis TaxID=320497 RepID=UPI0011911A75|nr:hypothetical protein [Neoasaia chiangmaiensis]GBR42617.1 hypothetical protein AA101099_2929 [Neoasaia chiangmaiensis NBRC 101099]GEN16251.1 hypothetical protein NCH01_26820 [Neoasaia chiangmaiensis]
MTYLKDIIKHFDLAEKNAVERMKALGTTRHIGNASLSVTEIERIISLIRADLKGQEFTTAKRANAYAETLRKSAYLRDANPAHLLSFFMGSQTPASEVSAFGWEQEDSNAELKGFGNALFVALGLLVFRDWERYHAHSLDCEIRYVQWFVRFAPDEFNAGASIALHAHFDLGFSLLAEMKGKDPLPWSPENMGGAL